MDKVQGANSGKSVPLWERQKSHRGHKTSVDGALEAHRKRVSERQARIERRLDLAKSVSSRFFPQPQMTQKPIVEPGSVQTNEINQVQAQIQTQAPQFIPNIRELDVIYDEAQMTPVSQQALQVIEKDLSNPEEAPQEDVPRGSYIDYVV